jgi:pyridinium-3,5-biscarboxylic acid mononucleotide synthase
MTANELRTILERLSVGGLTVDDALSRIDQPALAELGYATVDLDRRARCGYPEVIFCEGKTPEWVAGVAARIAAAQQDCLATRVSDVQSVHLANAFPNAIQDRLARTFWLPTAGPRPEPTGSVLIVTAGTGDLPVAKEAAVTAEAMGAGVELVVDVGVAGVHRILRQREKIARADAIVVVAGMDGALPSVVGGLADCPVIACPTSIGYGTAFGGVAALLTMLNACSANVTVVNIDAGFKAGYSAALIARRAKPAAIGGS